MGGIRYDHKNDREIEVDDLQTPIDVEFLEPIEAESGPIIEDPGTIDQDNFNLYS